MHVIIVIVCTAANNVSSLLIKILPKTVRCFFSSTSFGHCNDKGQCTGSMNSLVRILKMKTD